MLQGSKLRGCVQSRMVVKVGPFCRKGLCSLLQPATRSRLFGGQHDAVERMSALVVRLAAKVQPGRLDLPKSATAPSGAAAAGFSIGGGALMVGCSSISVDTRVGDRIRDELSAR